MKSAHQDQQLQLEFPVESVEALHNPVDSKPQKSDELDYKDLCSSDSCHAHDYDSDPEELAADAVPFDLKGKRFSEYLQELRLEGHDEPFEETMPSNFLVPDALSIMDARIAKTAELKGKIGHDEKSSGVESDVSLVERNELEMDPSLQQYLLSDNDDIMSHPLYKRLCAAHISLCKLGATDAQLQEMEELSHELESKLPDEDESSSSNPELDKFMNEYCEFLEQHKKEFEKPFDEAMEFCKQVDEELADSGVNFFRNKCVHDPSLTNETIARLQELPLEGEV
ncbi:hypothetical protein R1sor_014274 [Riccia sorocarpa]|uniref:KNOX2 domain-containing protein n=1 Tax=Riccia sorocarpa TaxID=122646 RepID=A0ABD3HCQ5_9MARC